jgi:hypothetical protein
MVLLGLGTALVYPMLLAAVSEEEQAFSWEWMQTARRSTCQ